MTRIDYFYSAHSAFAFLGAARFSEICKNAGVTPVHRPYQLSSSLAAIGAPSFSGRSQAHVDYFFGRELVRWAEWRGVEMITHRPTHHDADYSLANRAIIATQAAGLDTDALSRAILTSHWRDDSDLSEEATLCALITGLGMEAEPLLAAAKTDAIVATEIANTDEAIAKSYFGSPTYVVDGDPFYGQDHLDLVARAIEKPFAQTAFQNPSVDGG